VGTLVRDDCGTVWVNDGNRPACWVQPEEENHDPETWVKIAGNYGPVTVVKWPEGWCPCGHSINDDYRCIAGNIVGPCDDENCGGVCEYHGTCQADDCACTEDEDE